MAEEMIKKYTKCYKALVDNHGGDITPLPFSLSFEKAIFGKREKMSTICVVKTQEKNLFLECDFLATSNVSLKWQVDS